MAAFPSPGNVLVLPQAGAGANTLVLPQVYMPSAGFPIVPSDTPMPSNVPGVASQSSLAGGAESLPGAGLSLAGFAQEAIPILLELLGPVFALLMQQQQSKPAPARTLRRQPRPAASAHTQHAPAAVPRTSPLYSPAVAL